MVTQEMTTTRRCGPLLASIVALAALLRPAPAAGEGDGFRFRGSFESLDGSTAAGRLHATIGGGGSSMVVRARGLGDSVNLSLLVPEAGVGTAKARFRRDGDCTRDFRVEAEGVTPGSYGLCVGGVAFGSFEVVDTGTEIKGEIELDDDPAQPGERPFPTELPDPLEQRIEVREAAETSCTGALLFSFASFPNDPGGGVVPPAATCTPVDTGHVFLVREAGI